MSGRPGAGKSADGLEAMEITRFRELQNHFKANFERIFADPGAARTIVVVPSLTFDRDVLAKITGVHHYEERLLCLLLLLSLPRTRVIYVTSTPVSASIVDYYLHLLTGIPAEHARKRLVLLSCYDSSTLPLTAKVLARPRLIQRIREAIHSPPSAYITFFTVTELEKQLALKLDLPFYGCDPGLSHWGSKSGSRKIFKEAQIPIPSGFEDLRDAGDITAALARLKREKPQMRRALVKLNEGVSGEGNAIFDYADAPEGGGLEAWIRDRLPSLAFEAPGMTCEAYLEKFLAMQGIVEEFLDGVTKRSPSVQFQVDPLGHLKVISTHDQILGGGNAQIFLGCRFPAHASYRLAIQEQGFRAARILAEKGVVGRFGIDFISVKEGDGWRHYAIEINLRKGGTTHPFLMLQFLTGGHYDPGSGLFLTPSGRPCFYDASDNLQADSYQGLTPPDFIDIAVAQGLHFNAANQEGVVFHLLGALSEFGKVGILSIGSTAEKARALYQKSVEILDRESSLR